MATDRRFLHVAFDFKEQPDLAALNEVFDKAPDWIRYAPNCWLLWTARSPETWYTRLKELMRQGDRVFICELNIEIRNGWMPTSFWNFIQKHLSELEQQVSA